MRLLFGAGGCSTRSWGCGDLTHIGIGELVDATSLIGGRGLCLDGTEMGSSGLGTLVEDFLLSLGGLALCFNVVVGILYQFIIKDFEVLTFQVEDSLDLTALLVVVLTKEDFE